MRLQEVIVVADVINPQFGEHGKELMAVDDAFGSPSSELSQMIHHSIDIALMAAYVEGYIAGANDEQGE